jgi:hypothetical protein
MHRGAVQMQRRGEERRRVAHPEWALGAPPRAPPSHAGGGPAARPRQVVEAQARVHGCSGEVDWMEAHSPYYPPTVNDPGAYAFARGVAARRAPSRWPDGELLHARSPAQTLTL